MSIRVVREPTNVRPAQGNRSRSVDDPEIRDRIQRIVVRLVRR